jgi:hypothetical protein
MVVSTINLTKSNNNGKMSLPNLDSILGKLGSSGSGGGHTTPTNFQLAKMTGSANDDHHHYDKTVTKQDRPMAMQATSNKQLPKDNELEDNYYVKEEGEMKRQLRRGEALLPNQTTTTHDGHINCDLNTLGWNIVVVPDNQLPFQDLCHDSHMIKVLLHLFFPWAKYHFYHNSNLKPWQHPAGIVCLLLISNSRTT